MLSRTEYRRLAKAAQEAVAGLDKSRPQEDLVEMVSKSLHGQFPAAGPSTQRAASKAVRKYLGIQPARSGTAPNFCVVATSREKEIIESLARKDGTPKAAVFHHSLAVYGQIRKQYPRDWRQRLASAFPEVTLP